MTFAVQAESPPLRADADGGTLRVGNSRVLVDLVVRAFQDGATPETIVQRYPTLELSDVYAVIGYYLHHRGELDEYLTQREHMATDVRQQIERDQPDLRAIRERLLAARAAKG
jgi:uncharacterized protein (DUF433 family)